MHAGIKTTEFWGKTLLQFILVLNLLFGLGVDIDEQTSMTIVAGLEAAYTLARGLTKGLRKEFSNVP